MASDNIRLPISLNASADLSASQFYFVKIDTNGQLAVNTTSGAACAGVLQDKPTAQGQPGQICGPGDITKVIAGAGVSKGDNVSSTNQGKAATSTSGQHILGKALDSANSGEFFRVRFMPVGKL